MTDLRAPTINEDHSRAAVGGFTLIELMITVAIVAILTTIAIPSYNGYMIRSNRSQAEQLMTTIANREAQYLLDARAYTDQIGATGLNLTSIDGWSCTAGCTNGHYNVTVALGATPGDGFTISATPIGSQERDGTLQLTSGGTRTRVVGGVDKGW